MSLVVPSIRLRVRDKVMCLLGAQTSLDSVAQPKGKKYQKYTLPSPLTLISTTNLKSDVFQQVATTLDSWTRSVGCLSAVKMIKDNSA